MLCIAAVGLLLFLLSGASAEESDTAYAIRGVGAALAGIFGLIGLALLALSLLSSRD